MRLLVVEDDAMLGAALLVALKDAAYAADWVCDGPAADAALARREHQLVLLDLGLPRGDGLNVLRRVRAAENPVPVIVVSARDGVADRVHGLDLGADDYLIKPFDLAELFARMRAVMRRHTGQGSSRLSNGVVELDTATREARAHDRCALLSARESAVLELLLLRGGALVTRRELEASLFGWDEDVQGNAIDFVIHSVRRKLGTHVVRTARGFGWRVDKSA